MQQECCYLMLEYRQMMDHYVQLFHYRFRCLLMSKIEWLFLEKKRNKIR